MNAQEWLKACHQDLDRLVPDWLSLPEPEREWQIQRWLDRLEKQPEYGVHFRGALLQRVQDCESHGDLESENYHLSRALLHSLGQHLAV